MALDINLNLIPSNEKPSWAEQMTVNVMALIVSHNIVKEMIMALSASVQRLVDEVAASKSIQASSSAAMTELVTQSANLSKQIADLVAAGTAMSAEDMAAIDQASTDLAEAAVALQAAIPVNVPPAPGPTPDPIDPATPPVV